MGMKYIFIALMTAAIISQVPHAWYVFDSFSKLKGWLKITQSLMFCSILSVAIWGFVMIERQDLAILGAGIEMVINIYYYTLNFWSDGLTSRTKETRRKSIGKFWRQSWIKIFFSMLLPLLIFIFAEIIKSL